MLITSSYLKRTFAKWLILVSAILISTPAICEQNIGDGRISVGGGYGVLFGGIGVNIALVDDSNYRYASLGVISAYRSSDDGRKDSDVAYGVGLGWIKTDIIFPDSKKHGLGVYLGAVDADSRWSGEPLRRESLHTRYGGGVNYHYFASGPEAKGLVVGASLLFSSASNNKSQILATLGYRF